MLMNTNREDQEWTLEEVDLDLQLRELLAGINRVQDEQMKKDLLRMFRNVENKRSDMSREAVRCRNLNRTTGTMQNIQKELTELIATTEKFLTIALLAS
jgi:hypothetical protein